MSATQHKHLLHLPGTSLKSNPDDGTSVSRSQKDLGSLSYSTADLKLIEMVFTLMM